MAFPIVEREDVEALERGKQKKLPHVVGPP
jgi:hypothetical protein